VSARVLLTDLGHLNFQNAAVENHGCNLWFLHYMGKIIAFVD